MKKITHKIKGLKRFCLSGIIIIIPLLLVISCTTNTEKTDPSLNEDGGNKNDDSVDWTEIEDSATEIIDWTEIEDSATEIIDWTEIEDSATEIIDWTEIEDSATIVNPNEPSLPIINKPSSSYPSKWGVGSGKKWISKAYVPFVDFLSSNHANNIPNLVDYAQHENVDYFNLGFINMIGNSGLNANGSLNWAWGGYLALKEGSVHPQYSQIKKNIKSFRDNGGDITISFGGASGSPFWMANNATENNLVKTYVEIIEGYGLSRIDLDIEGSGENFERNKLNARAIKKVQELTGVEVVLTLPVNRNGLVNGYTNTQTYLKAGVDITAINIMSMYLGKGVGVEGIISSIDETKYQLQDIWMQEGKNLTDNEAYALLGVTPSIGFENSNHEPVSPSDWETVAQYAEEKNLSILSMWVANRDALDGWYSNQSSNPGGVKTKWQYGAIGRNNFTDQDRPIDVPTNPIKINDLSINNLTFQDVDLNWKLEAPRGTKTYAYLAEDNNEYKFVKELTNNNLQITNLKPNTKYFVVLANVNSNGDYLFSNVINFKTKTQPIDKENPVLLNDFNIDYVNSNMNQLVFEFRAATDDVGIKSYVVQLRHNNKLVKRLDLKLNEHFAITDEYIKATFENLSRQTEYQIQIYALDFSDKISNLVNNIYVTGDYPLFNYADSNSGKYKVGDIVRFTSKDFKWINAGIGERYYKKTGSWNGWAPDGSAFGRENSTSYSPGSTNSSETGWARYYD